MTHLYFVRHAQPDSSCPDDRTKPLTHQGMEDRKKVTALLSKLPIDAFYSSPYRRSVDTISESAAVFGMDITTDERFRERQVGENGYAIELVERRWADFDFCEEGGETLRSVQMRNIAALDGVLHSCAGQNIVVGSHGTALSAIINFCDPSFTCDDFKRIWHWMPYVVRLDFEDRTYLGREELLRAERTY